MLNEGGVSIGPTTLIGHASVSVESLGQYPDAEERALPDLPKEISATIPYHMIWAMTDPELLLVFLFVGLVSYTLIYLRLRGRRDGDGSDESATSTIPPSRPTSLHTRSGPSDSQSTVECQICRTENEPGYLFCKNCVTKLERSQSQSSAM